MEGWRGWDDYARFYDWENAQTMGRRDIRFWQRMAARTKGPILELGCGTGRVALPVAKDGATLVGIDRSETMLARARKKARPQSTLRDPLSRRPLGCGVNRRAGWVHPASGAPPCVFTARQ